MLPQDLVLETEPTKTWREGELVIRFRLNPIREELTPLMQEWLNAPLPTFDIAEQAIFDKCLKRAKKNINGWSEEDLKMKFIAHILDLGGFEEGDGITTCFDKSLVGVVEDVRFAVKSDFMVATGYMNVIQQPYFHFQEYKPLLNPAGEPMAQLLEAFLIAQSQNTESIPLYGVEVIGENWKFVIMEGKNYCISPAYNAIDREDLLHIIGILRKFFAMLKERLKNKTNH